MFRASAKPFTAVTVQIDRLTSEQYEVEDVAGIFDLVEVVRIQSSGPTEAARALRKKLKYGNPHRQLRALVILDGLLENAGSRFQRTFVDEPLLERLRQLPREDITDVQVRQKCQVLFVQWTNAYQNTAGLERIANLYKELPKSHRPAQARQKVLQETERYESDGETPAPSGNRSRAGSSATPASRSGTPVTLTSSAHGSSGFSKLSKRSKSGQGKPFNVAREKESMTTSIAQASIASTNLLNGLQLINRETQRVSENPEVVRRFETCKTLRRKILYYIQNVESDEWIGSLVNANDELVKALTAYEITDRSIDDDSDSDAWENIGTVTPDPPSAPRVDSNAKQLAGLKMQEEAAPPKPPRPGVIAMPPPSSFPNTQAGAQDTPGDGAEDPKPQSEDFNVIQREIDSDSDREEGDCLRRLPSRHAASIENRQNENDCPPRTADDVKAEQTQEAKRKKKFWQRKSDKPRPDTAVEQDLSLQRTPAAPQLLQSPDSNDPDVIAAERWRHLEESFGGRVSWIERQEWYRPKYAEDEQRFTSPKFGPKDPGLSFRLKVKLARIASAVANPKEILGRLCRILALIYCPCCINDPSNVRTPRIFVNSPSNEDRKNKRGRSASDGHATPHGSYLRSRQGFAHLKKAGELNQSRGLLKPPRNNRLFVSTEDEASIDSSRAATRPAAFDGGMPQSLQEHVRDHEEPAALLDTAPGEVDRTSARIYSPPSSLDHMPDEDGASLDTARGAACRTTIGSSTPRSSCGLDQVWADDDGILGPSFNESDIVGDQALTSLRSSSHKDKQATHPSSDELRAVPEEGLRRPVRSLQYDERRDDTSLTEASRDDEQLLLRYYGTHRERNSEDREPAPKTQELEGSGTLRSPLDQNRPTEQRVSHPRIVESSIEQNEVHSSPSDPFGERLRVDPEDIVESTNRNASKKRGVERKEDYHGGEGQPLLPSQVSAYTRPSGL